jgi:large-conductance mechanosensitive channel
VLVLCVVFSPVLFLGLIWPQFGKKTEELKQTLVGQLMFPIIYLLLIWVGLNFINIEKTAESVLAITDSKQFLNFGQQVKEIVFRFFVASALFITALTAAKQYSQMGSKGVSKLQGSIGKGIGTVAFGGAAVAGRTVVGGVGGRVLQGAGA